jgi:hypothetical protein
MITNNPRRMARQRKLHLPAAQKTTSAQAVCNDGIQFRATAAATMVGAKVTVERAGG